MIGRFLALIGRRSAILSAVALGDDRVAVAPSEDSADWSALLGPDQPIPPLEVLPPQAQPDRIATMRLVARLRQACGLEGPR